MGKKQEVNRPVSQFFPVYSEVHVHLYPPVGCCWQMPPWRHGCAAQDLASTYQRPHSDTLTALATHCQRSLFANNVFFKCVCANTVSCLFSRAEIDGEWLTLNSTRLNNHELAHLGSGGPQVYFSSNSHAVFKMQENEVLPFLFNSLIL